MKINHIFLMLSVIIFSFYGCEKNDAEIGKVRFLLEETEYKKGDTVKAYFINNKRQHIYRVRPSEADTWLEKFKDENWVALLLHPEYEHPPVVRYHKVKSRESVLIEYPYTRLERMVENTEGIYRFSETISPTPDYQSDHKKIVSKKFTIK